jgi:hypothetical protein
VGRLTVDPAMVGREVDLGTHDGVELSVEFPVAIDYSIIGGDIPEHPVGQVNMANAAREPVSVTYGDLIVIGRLSTAMDVLAKVGDDYQPTPAEDDEVKGIRRRATTAADRAFLRFVDLLAISEKRFAITIERAPLNIRLAAECIGLVVVVDQMDRHLPAAQVAIGEELYAKNRQPIMRSRLLAHLQDR